MISDWMLANLLRLNPNKTEFLLIGLQTQLAKISNPCLPFSADTVIPSSASARNLGFILDNHLSLSEQITSVCKSCFFHIRDLRRIRPYLSVKAATTLATSLVHSKLDYCNSLYVNLPNSQLHRLQLIQNALARAVVKAPKFSHVTPILRSLHWLKINERIAFKIASITYKVIQFSQPLYLHDLLNFRSPRNTRSSTCLTLQLPSCDSKLKITNRSFRHAAPRIWNSLPAELRILSPVTSSDNFSAPPLALSTGSFLSKLKSFLFHKSYPP
jgi:hypothetical protein